jgi:hypothetical protein
MDTPFQTLRVRIDELADELVRDLAAQGLPEEGVSLVRRMLEAELRQERLRPLIEASMDEPAGETLDRFVVSLDPDSHWVTLACKN